MAKSIKHSATLPDGTIAKLNSANRRYTHCIAYMRSEPFYRALADGFTPSNISNFKYYLAIADGSSEWLKPSPHASDVSNAARRAELELGAEQALMGARTLAEYKALIVSQALARHEARVAAGYFDQWRVYGWAGRPGLAADRVRACMGGYGVRRAVAVPAVIED